MNIEDIDFDIYYHDYFLILVIKLETKIRLLQLMYKVML